MARTEVVQTPTSEHLMRNASVDTDKLPEVLPRCLIVKKKNPVPRAAGYPNPCDGNDSLSRTNVMPQSLNNVQIGAPERTLPMVLVDLVLRAASCIALGPHFISLETTLR